VQTPPLLADHWLYSEHHPREQPHEAIDGVDGLLVLAHFFEMMMRRRTELLGYDCAMILVLQAWLLLLMEVLMLMMMIMVMMMLMMVLQFGLGMQSSRLLRMSMQR